MLQLNNVYVVCSMFYIFVDFFFSSVRLSSHSHSVFFLSPTLMLVRRNKSDPCISYNSNFLHSDNDKALAAFIFFFLAFSSKTTIIILCDYIELTEIDKAKARTIQTNEIRGDS